MKKITEFLFGVRAIGEKPVIGSHISCHGPFTTYGEWVKEFRVSMLYDRKMLHLD
jgi:hypothetical protein